MKFKDITVYNDDFFALGQETDSGRYYLSIPVSNRLVDYEEYYELTDDEFQRLSDDVERLKGLAQKCRERKNDDRLMMKPGSDRGHVKKGQAGHCQRRSGKKLSTIHKRGFYIT